MKTKRQTIELEKGDSVTLLLPDGSSVNVGFGGSGQVPPDNGWIITSANSNERGHVLTKNAKLEEYDLL